MNKTFGLPKSVIEQIKELAENEQIPQKSVLINAVDLYAHKDEFLQGIIEGVVTGKDSPVHRMIDDQTSQLEKMIDQKFDEVIKAINNREDCSQQSEKNK